jgi:hypothetical protein
MSVAKEAKQREWSCNIFDHSRGDREQQQLFTRKRRSELQEGLSSTGNLSFRSYSRSRQEGGNVLEHSASVGSGRGFDARSFNKRTDGALFLCEKGQMRGSLTPGFGSSHRVKDSLSMQKIL